MSYRILPISNNLEGSEKSERSTSFDEANHVKQGKFKGQREIFIRRRRSSPTPSSLSDYSPHVAGDVF